MGFMKIGDAIKITGITKADEDEIAFCPECDKPLVIIAINEDEEEIELVCKCQTPEMEQPDE